MNWSLNGLHEMKPVINEGNKMHKNLKVKQETHAEFKKLAQDKGVMFDPFLKSLMDDYKLKERIKELESLRAQGR